MTQNAADVRLFIRATAAARSVGAGGDGKFAYTMKQSLSAVDERRRVERTIEAKAVDALLNNAAAKLFDRGRGDPSVEQLLLCSFVWGLRLHVRRPYDTMMVRSFNAKDRGGLNVIYGSVKPLLLASSFPLYRVRMRPGSLISGDYGADSLTWLASQWTFPVPPSSFLMNGIT